MCPWPSARKAGSSGSRRPCGKKEFKESQSNSPDLAGLAGNLTVPMPLPAKQPDVHDVILSGQKYLEKKDVFQAAMEWRSGLADFPQDAQLHQSILAAIDKLLDDSLFSDANIIIRAINSGQQAGLPEIPGRACQA